MAFKIPCGLIVVLLAGVTRSHPAQLAPIGVFRTANAEMDWVDVVKYQGKVDDWHGTIGSIVQGECLDGKTSPSDGNFWDEKIYHDPKMIQIIPNEYPFGLPDGVEHWMMWTRESPLTPDLFKPLPHEDVPNQDFLNPVRAKALIRYINHYDFYGTSGISQEVLKDFVPSAFFHLGDKVWVDPESTETVTRTEGAEAMAWAGRHVATVIHTKFSPKEYEILFNRSPERWKSVINPDHFHVLVKRRTTEIRTASRLRSPSAPANHHITPEAPEMEMSEKSQGSSDKMLPPSSRKTFIPPSPRSSVNKKSSTAQRSVPGEFSASPSIRHGLYDPNGSARSPSLSGRRTPSVGDRPSAKRGPTEVENSLMNIFDDRGLIDTQESDKGPRKRALFGNPERKNKKRNEGIVRRRAKSKRTKTRHEVKDSQFNLLIYLPLDPPRDTLRNKVIFLVKGKLYRWLIESTRTIQASPVEAWWVVGIFIWDYLREQLAAWICRQRGRLRYPGEEDPPRFAEDRYEEPLRYPDEELRYGPYTGDSDGSPSSPYHEQIEDTERTILGPSSSPEMEKEKERKAPGLADLDESLKLVPDPGEYRPGAYNSLTDEQWLSAGQKLIEKFSENSQKVQKIISARAERMAGYTAMVSEYHNLLRQRRVELNRERESIQEGVLGSIAGYKKSNI
ncbi:hypothetical protein H4Q26_006671 [Puccinia striiformis f. sp. tritici PST-130]|nr:hypothetical protein H4Q26_006671 [Puccinia striiformis f. sp. tritici PST-130]